MLSQGQTWSPAWEGREESSLQTIPWLLNNGLRLLAEGTESSRLLKTSGCPVKAVLPTCRK